MRKKTLPLFEHFFPSGGGGGIKKNISKSGKRTSSWFDVGIERTTISKFLKHNRYVIKNDHFINSSIMNSEIINLAGNY